MNNLTYILVVVGAITSATRLATELEKKGCKSIKVIRTPIVLSAGGCSYSIKLPESDINILRSVVSIRRYRVKKIYSVVEEGRECEYNDIS